MKLYNGVDTIGFTDLSSIPESLFKNLCFIFKDKDLEIIRFIGNESINHVELLKAFDNTSIEDAYKRGIINKNTESSELEFIASPLANTVNIFATHMQDEWNKLDKKDRDAIANWHYDSFLNDKRRMGLEGMQKNENRVAPLDETIEFLKIVDAPITLINCDCKVKFQRCDFDKNICIEIGGSPNSSRDRGWGKHLSVDEAIELLHKTEEMGLIHNIESHAICNCCSCCCYPIRGSLDLDLVHVWPEHKYIIKMDAEVCISCGHCIERCQFDVFKEEEGEIIVDTQKCWGCGVCASTCPLDALSLVNR